MCRREAANARLCAQFANKAGKISFTAGTLFLAISASAAQAKPMAEPEQTWQSAFGYPLFDQSEPQQQPTPSRHYRARHRAATAMQDVRGGWGDAPASALGSNSSTVLSEASRWVGQGNVTGSHRAWCADFANFVLRRTGHRASGSGMVNSLLGVGPRVSQPAQGDLVVMRNHVTIFAGYGGRGFYGLGGNQHHRVAMSNFPLRSVVAFVRPN